MRKLRTPSTPFGWCPQIGRETNLVSQVIVRVPLPVSSLLWNAAFPLRTGGTDSSPK